MIGYRAVLTICIGMAFAICGTETVKILKKWGRSGSVVECLTRDRGAAGSSLTSVTALWSFSKTHVS